MWRGRRSPRKSRPPPDFGGFSFFGSFLMPGENGQCTEQTYKSSLCAAACAASGSRCAWIPTTWSGTSTECLCSSGSRTGTGRRIFRPQKESFSYRHAADRVGHCYVQLRPRPTTEPPKPPRSQAGAEKRENNVITQLHRRHAAEPPASSTDDGRNREARTVRSGDAP